MNPQSFPSREHDPRSDPPSRPIDMDHAAAEVDLRLIADLEVFDEQLRQRETVALADSRAAANDNRDLRGAQACLTFLERAFPRLPNGSRGGSLPGTGTIGRFELVRVLGQGGFGVVYLARDPRLDRLVALKVPRLHALASGSLHERFLREARAAGGLEHPNIVPVLETGEAGLVCYIASLYCDGPNLAQWIKAQEGPIAAGVAARIVQAIAEATQFSHSRGILHRDLKPGNVLLAKRPDGARRGPDELPFVPRVSDFGLAKFTEPGVDETGTSAVMGTPHYVSPEQACGAEGDIGPQSDVYSLGVILYELLTGRPPFQGRNFVEVLDQIRSADAVPPTRLVAGVPRDLETICLTCLQKSPERRYSTAQGLVDDLTAFLEGRPIAARPAHAIEMAAKWVRRRPTVAALLVVTVMSAVVLFLLQWRHGQVLEENLRTTDRLRMDGLDREKMLRLQFEAQETDAGGREFYAARWQSARRRWGRLQATMVEDRQPGADIESEWNYVWRQLQNPEPILTLGGHDCPVYSVAVSPDGRWIASGDERGTVKVRERASGREVASMAAHNGEVRALAFAPEGNCLASGGQFHFVKIWRTRDWGLEKEFDAHDGTTTSLHFSAKGRLLASGGRDGFIKLWKTSNWRRLKSIPVGDVVNQVHLAADEKRLFSTDKGKRVSIWRFTEKNWRRSDLRTTPDNPLAFGATPDGRFAILPNSGATIHINTSTKTSLAMQTSITPITACMAVDGSWAISAGRDGQIDITRYTGRTSSELPFDGLSQQTYIGHVGIVSSVAIVPGVDQFVSAGHDGFVRVWNLASLPPPRWHFLTGHTAGIRSVAFSSDSSRLATCGIDGRIRLRSTCDWRLLDTLDWSTRAGHFRDVYFGVDEHILIARSSPPNDCLVEWRPGSDLAPREISSHPYIATAQSVDRRWLAGLSEPNVAGTQRVELWDLATLSASRTIGEGVFSARCLRFSPDGSRVALGGGDIHLVELGTGKLRRIVDYHGQTVVGLAFDADGSSLAACALDGAVHLIDVDGGLPRVSMQVGQLASESSAIDFSPDGKVLAMAVRGFNSDYGATVLWNLRAERPALVLEQFNQSAATVRYSPDGSLLAAGLATTKAISPSGSYSGIIVWRFDPPRAPLKALIPPVESKPKSLHP